MAGTEYGKVTELKEALKEAQPYMDNALNNTTDEAIQGDKVNLSGVTQKTRTVKVFVDAWIGEDASKKTNRMKEIEQKIADKSID